MHLFTAGKGGQYGFSGEEVSATEAFLSFPISVFVDEVGNVFIAELERCTIRKVSAATNMIYHYRSCWELRLFNSRISNISTSKRSSVSVFGFGGEVMDSGWRE